MKGIDKEFFDRVDRIVSEAGDYREKAEFVKTFFQRRLGIDVIEDSMINFGRMRSKTFYYLILSAIIEYSSMLDDFKSAIDTSEAKKRLESKLSKIDRKIFYLFIGQVDPSEVNINAAEEINYYRAEMGRIVGEMTRDTLIVFTNRERQLILNLISDIISDNNDTI
jgi:hypothetical protein